MEQFLKYIDSESIAAAEFRPVGVWLPYQYHLAFHKPLYVDSVVDAEELWDTILELLD